MTTTARRWLVGALVLLAVGIASTAIVGPLVTGVLVYRTSETTRNQVVGGDLAGLAVVAPIALGAAILVARRSRAGPVVALAPAAWAIYMSAQLAIGQEHLRTPGNGERFFPLLLAVFVVGEAVFVLAWRAVGQSSLPPIPRRLGRVAGAVLVGLAGFLVVGLHLPGLLDALGRQPSALEYTSSPTAFWIVKLMDLGVIVPAALVVGVGLRRHAAWAGTPAYALLGGYTLLGAAVTGMAVVMAAADDPDGSVANVVAFGGFTVALGWLTARLYRPLFADPDADLPVAQPSGASASAGPGSRRGRERRRAVPSPPALQLPGRGAETGSLRRSRRAPATSGETERQ